MRLLSIDQEARDLLHAASEMAHAALDARARRVDPEGVISRSVNMSRIKMRTVLEQLEAPALPNWSELSEGHKTAFRQAVQLLQEHENDEYADAAYDHLRCVLLDRGGTDKPLPPFSGKS